MKLPVKRCGMLCLLLALGAGIAPAQASTAELTPILETLVELNGELLRAPETALAHVDAGVPLKMGARGKRVAQLKQRLQQLGYATGAAPDLFDAPTDAAVRAFQAKMGGTVDGIVDEHTRFNLNLSLRDKIALLRAQFAEMETLFADHAARRFVVVNLPAYRLYAFDGERRALESRVVVGQPARPTPLMKTALTGIVVNPAWSPPPTILAKDIFRSGEIDPRTVSKLGLQLIDGHGQPVPLAQAATPGDLADGGYRFVQAPGERNALGRLKFDLDNPFSVYMHDTNHRELFAKSSRALSSGCIRVERFRELAGWVLGENSRIERELADRRTRRLPAERLPVHTVYWLAEVVNGKVIFHRDIYGRFAAAR